MKTSAGGRASGKIVVGLGLALGLVAGGLAWPATAAAAGGSVSSSQSVTSERSPRYGVPDRGRGDDRPWDDRDRGRGGHDFQRGGYDWHGRPSWPYDRPWHGPVYYPGQWVWNGWGWAWTPGYWAY